MSLRKKPYAVTAAFSPEGTTAVTYRTRTVMARSAVAAERKGAEWYSDVIFWDLGQLEYVRADEVGLAHD